jgi:hypothetical protein
MYAASLTIHTGDSLMARRNSLLLAIALVLAACGSGDSDTTTTLLPPVSTTAAETTTTTTTAALVQDDAASSQLASIRAAISQSSEIASGRMLGSIQVIGAVEGGTAMDFTIPFEGSFDTATGNSSFLMDLSVFAEAAGAAGEDIPAEFADLFGEMEIRVVDGISYIKFPFFGMMFGAETPWISAPAEEGTDLAGEFTFGQGDNPTEFLSQLEDAEATVTEVGRETVNGVDTMHYLVIFDSAALLENATPEERAELEAEGMFPDGELPMDIWISDNGLVVRYVIDVDGTAMPGEDGDQFERMIMTFDLLDIDQPVEIVAPDASEVTDMETLGAGFMGGGLFGPPEG